MAGLNFVSRELNITLNEKAYKIRYPSVGDIRVYNKELHAKGAVELEVVAKMLHTLGMPVKVVETMELPFIEAVVEELTSRKK